MKHVRRVDPEKKRQRIALFGSIFMIALLLFSSVAYYYDTASSGSQSKFNGFEFTPKTYDDTRGVWVTTIDGEEIEFQSLPPQVTSIPYDASITPLLANAQYIGITADPAVDLDNAPAIGYVRLQLYLAWKKTFNGQIAPQEGTVLPVFGCANATAGVPVIFFNVSNETAIRREGDCVIVTGEQRGLLEAKDRLIFEYFGMLNNGEVPEE